MKIKFYYINKLGKFNTKAQEIPEGQTFEDIGDALQNTINHFNTMQILCEDGCIAVIPKELLKETIVMVVPENGT